MNLSVKSVIVLAAICFVITLLLSVVNYFTAPVIEQANKAAAQASLYQVLPDAEDFELLALPDDSPETVTGVYRDTAGMGYAVTVETSSQYSDSPMRFTVGISSDGTIADIVLTSYAESKDFGKDTYPASYIGEDSALSGVDLVAGVTYSSSAFSSGVSDACTALLSVADVAAGEISDAQLASNAAAELLPAAVNNAGSAEMTLDEESGLYVAANKTGYVMISENGDTRTAYAADAFGNYVGCVSADGDLQAAEDAQAIAALEQTSVEYYLESSEKTITRICKIYEDAEVTVLSPKGISSHVNGAYSFTSGGSDYYALTVSPFGYGGAVNMLCIVDTDGNIAKLKVISHNETEYYGAAVAESSYTSGFEGEPVGGVDDEIVVISGCTYTTSAVRTALADVSEALPAVKEAQ